MNVTDMHFSLPFTLKEEKQGRKVTDFFKKGENFMAITLAVCLDDMKGMLYNHRRQSRDRLLYADLLAHSEGALTVAPYSRSLFPADAPVTVAESPLDAVKDGYAFIEEPRLINSLDKVERVIVYGWLKLYPRDESFPFDLEREGFKLVGESELVGSSHDKIWKGIYEK